MFWHHQGWIALMAWSLWMNPAQALEGLEIPTNPFVKPRWSHNLDMESTPCTHFTGDWEGRCEGQEGSKAIQLRIDQPDCYSITVDGTPFAIDGMSVFSSSQSRQTNNDTIALSWDDEKEKLVGNNQTLGQNIGKRYISKFQTKNRFTLEMNKQNLIITSEFHSEAFGRETKKVEKGERVCKLVAKSEENKIK